MLIVNIRFILFFLPHKYFRFGFAIMLASLVLLVALVLMASSYTLAEIHVCQAADPAFLGEYLPGSQKFDGTSVYSNANDMSFFRHNGFWYAGNLGPSPPETHYRCVEAEGCNFQMEVPPTSAEGAWKGSKRFNLENSQLIVSSSPCPAQAHAEL